MKGKSRHSQIKENKEFVTRRPIFFKKKKKAKQNSPKRNDKSGKFGKS